MTSCSIDRGAKHTPPPNCPLGRLSRRRFAMDREMSDGDPPRLDFTSLPNTKPSGDEVGRAIVPETRRSKLITAQRATVTPAPAIPSINRPLR